MAVVEAAEEGSTGTQPGVQYDATGWSHSRGMEFLAEEIIAPYFDSLFSPGVLAAATVTTLMFVSGLGARAVEWCEVIGRAWHSSVTRAASTRRNATPRRRLTKLSVRY